MTPNTTHIANMASSTKTPETKIKVTTNITSLFSERIVEEIMDSLDNIELIIILIFTQIALVLLIKVFKMCTKLYHKHNEIIIKKHNQISPEIL